MTRKVFIVNNMTGTKSLTVVTTTDVARYIDWHEEAEMFTPIIVGNLGLEATECEGLWIGDLDDRMFDADKRKTEVHGTARFWAERRYVA